MMQNLKLGDRWHGMWLSYCMTLPSSADGLVRICTGMDLEWFLKDMHGITFLHIVIGKLALKVQCIQV